MKKVKYTNAPDDIDASLEYLLAHPTPIMDNLPSPAEFAKMLAKEKISLNVDRQTVNNFRAAAKKHGLKYQVLMNQVLTSYAKYL